VVAPGEARGRLVGGGVGIGIPYTGPQGEPIFGLTPEQRLAQVPKKKRWPLYAGIIGAAVIAGVAIAVVTAPSSDGKLDPSTPAGAAAEALARGDAAHALEILAQHASEIERDADAQLVAGNARAALRQTKEALAAYDNVLALAPELESDRVLRANLKFFAAQKGDPALVAAAFELWAGHTQDPDAKPALAAAAVSQDLRRRHAVYPIVERYHLADSAHVDFVQAYALDLEQEPTCELRKAAVAHLRALSDPRAINALEVAIERKIHDKGPQYGKPYNACLVKDAKDALAYLRVLGKTK
jgi:tetratricopeptide (TPR) repeat protein